MTTLAQYDAARAALAAATRIDQVMPLREQMEHIKLHARHVQDRELMADASEIQIRAEAKLGFLLAEAKKAGWLKASRPKKADPEKPDALEGFTLKEIGVTEKLSSEAQKKASISERALDAMIQGVRDRIISGKARVIETGPIINGARSVMGSRVEAADSLDYFPTPPWATRALCQHVLPMVGLAGRRFGSVWEPACGEGHIAEVLTEYADRCIATDIHDYGYGTTLDFLGDLPADITADWIVTNPPFKKDAEAFVLRALDRAREGVAMFLRLQWLESNGRYERIFQPYPPALIAQFAERVPLCKGRWDPEGDTATAYLWIVWRKNQKAKRTRTEFTWIPPGQREALTHADDATRFTTNPVTKRSVAVDAAGEQVAHDIETGEVNEPQLEPAPG